MSNTEWLDDLIDTSRMTGDAYLQFVRAKQQILSYMNKQINEARMAELDKALHSQGSTYIYIKNRIKRLKELASKGDADD